MKWRSMDLRAELEKILHDVGPENIWRPVYDNENVLLANGIADKRETDAPRTFQRLILVEKPSWI